MITTFYSKQWWIQYYPEGPQLHTWVANPLFGQFSHSKKTARELKKLDQGRVPGALCIRQHKNDIKHENLLMIMTLEIRWNYIVRKCFLTLFRKNSDIFTVIYFSLTLVFRVSKISRTIRNTLNCSTYSLWFECMKKCRKSWTNELSLQYQLLIYLPAKNYRGESSYTWVISSFLH